MHYIIFDLEATCWQNRDKEPNEIIEIGAVAVSAEAQILGEYTAFVKPKIHPQLSDFCISLTHITQEMVDDARSFPEVCSDFKNWIGSFGNDYLLCSWGHYDKVQLRNDCRLHNINADWVNAHISLKHQYEKIGASRKLMGMMAALKRENIPHTGTHHRGIDDARNITQIFLRYFGKWKTQN